MVYYLTRIKSNVTKPTVLHIVTKKGKGYLPAENDPESYHSVSGAGVNLDSMDSSVAVGDTLVKLASECKERCGDNRRYVQGHGS